MPPGAEVSRRPSGLRTPEGIGYLAVLLGSRTPSFARPRLTMYAEATMLAYSQPSWWPSRKTTIRSGSVPETAYSQVVLTAVGCSFD